ncbi:unnamed protein product [Hydatigera taeniaeformis]|uniref:Uncharacterized protein n=1 Tax=Hydatigena taeniaeformis TaxID=6205 RepID=A0A0R3WYA7_HYDTA|nr:unnamed protein product [Hydatigera taeniaeformis]
MIFKFNAADRTTTTDITMVPFSPSHSQAEDFRQYRTESGFHPKAYDTFATTSFYAGSGGSRWDTGEAHLYPPRGESYYEPSAAQYASYFTGATTLGPPVHPFATGREEFDFPNGSIQQSYNGGMLQEIK